jgi:hypothetical protein
MTNPDEEIRSIVDFAKLVGGELKKIDNMSISDDKLPKACNIDINKIIPKIPSPVEKTSSQNTTYVQEIINEKSVHLKTGNAILDELIKMNQKFDLLLTFFLKKKKRRKSKIKVLTNGPTNNNSNNTP